MCGWASCRIFFSLRMAFIRCLIFITLLANCAAAVANEPPSVNLSFEQGLSLSAGWITQGRLEDAEKLLALLEKVHPEDPELLFLKGQVALRKADYSAAIELFRTLLTQDPSRVRVRLELARALYLAHNYDAARYHFEIALGTDLPETVRDNILRFLRAIYAQTTFVTISALVVTDTNPNRATTARTVNILGQTFVLNPDARARPGVGLNVFGQARYAFGAENRSFIRGSFEWLDYPGRFADFGSLQITMGHNVFVRNHVWTLEAGPLGSLYQGRELYAGGLMQVTHASALGERLLSTQFVNWRRLNYASSYDYLTADQLWTGANLQYAFDSTSSLFGIVRVGLSNAKEKSYSYRAGEVSVGYSKELPARFNVQARLTAGQYRYRAEVPLFGVTREDQLLQADVDVVARNWSVAGFAPRLTVGFAMSRSNISLYTYNRNYVGVGVTREF